MIAALRGKLRRKLEDRVVVESGGVGYEVFLPPVTLLPLTPTEVKRGVTANGAASKAQVQRGVQRLLGLPHLPRPSHVADALGLALIGFSRVTGRAPR